MWTTVRTFLIVSVITVLIWAYAEAESLTTKSLRVDLNFLGDPQSGRFVEVADSQGWTGRAEILFEGSTASIGNLEPALRKGISLQAGASGVPLEPGEYVVDLNQVLRAVRELDAKGVTVVRVEPQTLKVTVDTLVSREVKVVTDVAGAVVDGAVEVKPQKAKITLPSSLAGRLTAESAVTARIPPDSISRLVPGRLETIPGVPLLPPTSLPATPRITIDPDRADVVLKLRSRTDVFTIASVPVHIKIAVGEIGRWNISVPEEDRFIRDVKVSGPSDLVDRVGRGEIRVTAVLPLSFDELERGITTKDVVFAEVPTDLKFDADRTTVRLGISRRAPGETPLPGS